jgi:hypothetical protein
LNDFVVIAAAGAEIESSSVRQSTQSNVFLFNGWLQTLVGTHPADAGRLGALGEWHTEDDKCHKDMQP